METNQNTEGYVLFLNHSGTFDSKMKSIVLILQASFHQRFFHNQNLFQCFFAKLELVSCFGRGGAV